MSLPDLSERYGHILDQREEFPADGHFKLDNKPSTCCIYIYTFSLFLNFGVFHISTPFTIQGIVYKNFLLLMHVNKTQDIAKKDVVDNIWSYVIWSFFCGISSFSSQSDVWEPWRNQKMPFTNSSAWLLRDSIHQGGFERAKEKIL